VDLARQLWEAAWSPGLSVAGTPSYLPFELAHWDVSAVPDAELALARTFLANRGGYTQDARCPLGYELAGRIWPLVAGPTAPMPAEWFLEAVLLVKSADHDIREVVARSRVGPDHRELGKTLRDAVSLRSCRGHTRLGPPSRSDERSRNRDLAFGRRADLKLLGR